MSVKSTSPPFLILAFRSVLASAPFAAVMCPRSTLLPSPHWSNLRSRLLPDSQSGITSRKSGLRGRPRGYRVPFGTGPKGLHEIFEGLKGVGTKQLFLEVPFCVITRRQRISAEDHGSPKCPSVVPFEIVHSEGPFKVASFEHFGLGTTLQYGSPDCFHSEVPFRGRCTPFGTHQYLKLQRRCVEASWS